MLITRNAVAPVPVRLVAPKATWSPPSRVVSLPSEVGPTRLSQIVIAPPSAPSPPFIDSPFVSFLIDLAGVISAGILAKELRPQKRIVTDPVTGQKREAIVGSKNWSYILSLIAGGFGVKGLYDLSRIK
jgi:hypothetical protein